MENFFSETYFADKFICIRFTNNEKTVKQIDKHLKSRFIQFHFILKIQLSLCLMMEITH